MADIGNIDGPPSSIYCPEMAFQPSSNQANVYNLRAVIALQASGTVIAAPLDKVLGCPNEIAICHCGPGSDPRRSFTRPRPAGGRSGNRPERRAGSCHRSSSTQG